jgi:hypothetical protein
LETVTGHSLDLILEWKMMMLMIRYQILQSSTPSYMEGQWFKSWLISCLSSVRIHFQTWQNKCLFFVVYTNTTICTDQENYDKSPESIVEDRYVMKNMAIESFCLLFVIQTELLYMITLQRKKCFIHYYRFYCMNVNQYCWHKVSSFTHFSPRV